jgi:WD40 repeat protein
VQTGKELPSQAGHPMAIDHIEFHQSGKLLVTTGEDGTLRVWGVPAV